jgi:hypothetical protein
MTIKTETIDYNMEYKEHKRCPNCNRKTTGIEQYQNIRGGGETKTCDKCRKAVYKSYKKKPRNNSRPITMKDKIKVLKTILEGYTPDNINSLIVSNPICEKYLKTFIPAEPTTDNEQNNN